MKKLIFTLCAFLSLAIALPAMAQTDSPVEFIRENSRQVLDLLKKEDATNVRKIRDQVEALVIPKFDFKRMTA